MLEQSRAVPPIESGAAPGRFDANVATPASAPTADRPAASDDALPLGWPRTIALLPILTLSGIMASGQLYVAIPLSVTVAAHFGLPLSQAVLIETAFGLFYAIGFVVFGRLSDVFGRRHIVVGGQFATAVATLLVGLAPTFPLLLATRALQGLVAANFGSAGLAFVSEILPARWRPLGISIVSFGLIMCAPLAQLAGGWWPGGREMLMLDLAPIYLVTGGAIFALTAGVRPPPAAARSGWRAALKTLAADRGIVAVWIAALTGLFGYVTFYAGLRLVYPAAAHLEQTLRFWSVFPIFLAFAAAPLITRIGSERTAALGLSLLAAALVVGAIGSTWLLAGSLLSAAGLALTLPGFIGTVSRRSATATRGLGLALYGLVLFVGASFAPVIVHAGAHWGVFGVWLLPALAPFIGAGIMVFAGRS